MRAAALRRRSSASCGSRRPRPTWIGGCSTASAGTHGPYWPKYGPRCLSSSLRSKDFAEAKAIADSDPFHKAGLRTYTLRRWTVNEGSYSIRVNYSDQSYAID